MEAESLFVFFLAILTPFF